MQVCSAESNLEPLWASNKGYVRRLLADLTSDPDLADDLLQETCLKAAAGFAGYRGGNIKAWLGTIARNTFYSHARKHSYSHECPLEQDAHAAAGLELGSGLHLSMLDVRAAISALPANLREVLIMKHYSGFTYEEMATRLSRPSGTLRNQVHQAVCRLRSSMGLLPTRAQECAYSSGTALIDYLYGITSPRVSAETREHLGTCPACRENAEHIRDVMVRLDKLENSHKMIEILDLDPQGVPTLYYDTSVMNRSPQPLEHAVFRMNNLSTLLHVAAQGREVGCEHDRDERLDWDRGHIIRGRYVVQLPEPILPGERLGLLTVSRMHPERSAQQLSDGRFRFRWTQFPTVRWAAESPGFPVGYSQAIRLPKGSRLLKAYPLPAEIRTEGKTTLIWRSVISRFGPFDCFVEYRVRPDWPEMVE